MGIFRGTKPCYVTPMGADDTARTLPVQKEDPRKQSGVREVAQQAPATSILVFHPDGARVASLRAGHPIVVGRSAPSDITVPDANLSREHARFTLRADGTVFVEDLASTNGTLVAGEPIEQADLRPGHEVTIGASTATVFQGDGLAGGQGSLSVFSGYDRLRSALEAELVRSRFLARPMSVLSISAKGADAPHVRLWAMQLKALLRPIDRVGLYSDDSVHVLLPEVAMKQARETAEGLVRSFARAKERPIAVRCGVASFPASGTSVEELLGESRSAARSATSDAPVAVANEDGPGSVTRPESRVGTLVAESHSMRQLLGMVDRVAKGHLPVLLHGETGTGKEVLSRYMHLQSARKSGPLVCVNCAAIPQQLVESTLFGHERGAFTGANLQQKGVFEAADGGTVFLDEIGELAPSAQAALLRVLETKRFTRVGGTKEIEVNVRVIAATHRDLETMAEEGSFRQDLLFRLNAVTLCIPRLQDRAADIPVLASRFLEDANAAQAGTVRGFDPSALELLVDNTWPGNVRELKNAVERAVVIARGDLITIDDLPERVRDRARPQATTMAPPDEGEEVDSLDEALTGLRGDFRTRIERLESRLLVLALRDAGWNQTETARRLGMSLRTLVYKIRMHGIRRPENVKR